MFISLILFFQTRGEDKCAKVKLQELDISMGDLCSIRDDCKGTLCPLTVLSILYLHGYTMLTTVNGKSI